MNQSQLINCNELAKRWNVPIGTIWALLSQKKLPHLRLSKRIIRFDLKTIEKFESERQIPATSKATSHG